RQARCSGRPPGWGFRQLRCEVGRPPAWAGGRSTAVRRPALADPRAGTGWRRLAPPPGLRGRRGNGSRDREPPGGGGQPAPASARTARVRAMLRVRTAASFGFSSLLRGGELFSPICIPVYAVVGWVST